MHRFYGSIHLAPLWLTPWLFWRAVAQSCTRGTDGTRVSWILWLYRYARISYELYIFRVSLQQPNIGVVCIALPVFQVLRLLSSLVVRLSTRFLNISYILQTPLSASFYTKNAVKVWLLDKILFSSKVTLFYRSSTRFVIYSWCMIWGFILIGVDDDDEEVERVLG